MQEWLSKRWEGFKKFALTTEADRKENRELEKERIKAGSSFNLNKAIMDTFIFIGVMTAMIIGALSIFGGSIIGSLLDTGNKMLNENDVSTSMDFDSNVDMKFDGYFTTQTTKEVVKIDPSCQDTFEYMDIPNSYPITISERRVEERLKDHGWSSYYSMAGDNETIRMFKKNLKDCERETIEKEYHDQFIPTNLTVNGIAVNGSMEGELKNMIGLGILALLQDKDLNDLQYGWKYFWRN